MKAMRMNTSMKTLIVSLLFTSATALMAQDGVSRKYHHDGSVKTEYVITGDLVTFSTYSTDGTLQEKGAYLAGKPHGDWQQFNAQGAVTIQGTFSHGLRTGQWSFLQPNGNKAMELQYADGLLVSGEQFDEQGALIAVKGQR